ncbi:hypothetical protein TrVE_jg5150 [Triparma verrucosa]|uniref:Uncharacterized protein n=1 Tax=Triparma verrucosa TaxID=1606542 RepID=A0A9W7EMX6_9STRA|nr:hypothetical protein TrVE_jg5150 [Triparma verrucosa]
MSQSQSLRTLVQSRLLSDVLSPCTSSSNWSILLVDSSSMRTISSCVGMYQLMEERITSVDGIESKRQPMPEMDGIYLVEPESVDLVIKDFENAKKPMYKNVHLFFMTRVSEEGMAKIKAAKNLLKRIKTFSEVNLSFLTPNSHTFHLDLPLTYRPLYLNPPGNTVVGDIAGKLVTVCATMNEYPHVRFDKRSRVARETAQEFHERLNVFMSQNPSWWFHGGQSHTTRSRSTLLLLDRTSDPLTPLLHEFTYEAMLNDLLPLNGDAITYVAPSNSGKSEPKDVLLNESDPLWLELRHSHIADVITSLSNRIREFVSSNGGAALAQNSGSDMSLSEMSAALKELPEYRETLSKLSQHMHLAHRCMDVFGSLNLSEISELEQTLSTGCDSEGKVPKSKVLVDNLIDVLAGNNDRNNSVRLIMIYIISQQGITEDDRKRLFSAAGLDEDEKSIILNLEKLGVTLQQTSVKTKSFTSMFRSKRVKSTGKSDKDSVYAMSSVRRGKDSGGDGKASNSRWGGTAGAETSNSTNPKDLVNRKFTGGRQIVFQIGGVCHSEIRAGYEVMAGNKGGKEVIVGSTSFIKPAEYLEYIKSLS